MQYGMTLQEFDVLVKKQAGRCAICGKFASQSKDGVLEVDHDHITGKVRGLLCHLCNSAIGLFQERKDLLDRALTYLRESSDATR